ncbi:MAG: RlmE family RNA methyltransferase [Rhodoferax sp.]|nr:RlmE family RNA methyltransferase [Rhodoferax sp.]
MKSAVKSSKVNRAWLNDHVNDTYVKLAQKDGYRARAAYKLKEIDETLHLIQAGQLVVDLGSAPGAWSQYARRKLAPKSATGGGAAMGALNGRIIALDMLPMEPIEDVLFVQGDIHDEAVLAQLTHHMQGQQADVVLSDMAPNLSGIASSDAARIELLVELALEFAQTHLKPQGALVAKVFHGASYEPLFKRFNEVFATVKRIKPKASRDKSAETFLVGKGVK